LLRNANQQFVCKNVYIKGNDGVPLKIPIAHGEGRFYGNEQLLDSLEGNGQVIYRYCDEAGNLTEDSNPNGSQRNIAGIRNAAGNVFGMMPHPERATSEVLGNTDGLAVFNQLFRLKTSRQMSF
jgi:phosphoribosylformylglycinamidine synthase subunit PurQ / glutaminase